MGDHCTEDKKKVFHTVKMMTMRPEEDGDYDGVFDVVVAAARCRRS